MGLLVRVAHSLQLHREESYASLAFFKAQLYRRAWFSILGLDCQTAFDRGTDPAVPANSYNTKLPANINDAELTPDTRFSQPEPRHFTDMTFSRIASECANLIRQLSLVPVSLCYMIPPVLRYH